MKEKTKMKKGIEGFKIGFYHIIFFIVLMAFLGAYVDTIRTGTFPFQQYIAINLWEGGLVIGGIAVGMILERWIK